MKNIIVPVAALFGVFAAVVVGLICYFRFLRHRSNAAVMARYQELAEQSVRTRSGCTLSSPS